MEYLQESTNLLSTPDHFKQWRTNKQIRENRPIVYSTELIEKLDAKSAKRLWRALDNENYYTQQEFWSVKKDGTESKHTFSGLTKVERKNVGKSY